MYSVSSIETCAFATKSYTEYGQQTNTIHVVTKDYVVRVYLYMILMHRFLWQLAAGSSSFLGSRCSGCCRMSVDCGTEQARLAIHSDHDRALEGAAKDTS